MWKVVGRFMPGWLVARRLSYVAGVAGIAAAAFFWGRQIALSQTRTTDPIAGKFEVTPVSSSNGDYSRRVVAYIHGNIPITREDLGEYLIARIGTERVEALVNRRILELACRAQGVYVTDAEVQAQLNEDLKALGNGITEKDFAGQILKRFNKTLFEWKEDVIRPRLALMKMARPHVQVSDEDLRKAYEAKFGPKVQCRMIVLAEGTKAHWSQIWEKVRSSEDEFRNTARTQFIPQLAAEGGQVPPVHKHFGDPNLEREAFSLKPGEVSSVIQMKDKTAVILKCDAHVPADDKVRFEEQRIPLLREIEQAKLNQKVPEMFQQLRRQAAPSILLGTQTRQDDLERAVQRELNPNGSDRLPSAPVGRLEGPPAGSVPPNSNAPTTPTSRRSEPISGPPATSLNPAAAPSTGLPITRSQQPQGN